VISLGSRHIYAILDTRDSVFGRQLSAMPDELTVSCSAHLTRAEKPEQHLQGAQSRCQVADF
jgi:hypothetical protein